MEKKFGIWNNEPITSKLFEIYPLLKQSKQMVPIFHGWCATMFKLVTIINVTLQQEFQTNQILKRIINDVVIAKKFQKNGEMNLCAQKMLKLVDWYDLV